MNKLFLIFFCTLLFVACSDKNSIPKGIIKPGKMEKVMWDMFMAQAWAQQAAVKDSTIHVSDKVKEFSQYAFDINQITEKEFVSSYNWYLKNPGRLKPILDSLSAHKSFEENPETEVKPAIEDRPEMEDGHVLDDKTTSKSKPAIDNTNLIDRNKKPVKILKTDKYEQDL